MLYLYSRNASPKNKGGTEKLEELLIRKYSISKINSFEELTRKKGLLILIGTSLSTVLKVCTYSKCKIFWLKTATYSNKRYIVEYLLNIFLSWKINTIVITNTQKKIYPFSIKLDLLDLYKIEKLPENLNAALQPRYRKYMYGYVGRVDKEKGFFVAVEIIQRLSERYKTVLDLLVWAPGDLEYVPTEKNNLKILTGGRDKNKPIFTDVENIILPYESLNTTIAFPLVLLEAVLSGCNVFTTTEVRTLALTEFPSLAKNVFDLKTLENAND